MFCVKCGNEIKEGALFCTKCGAKVSAESTFSQKEPTKKKSLLPVIIVILIVAVLAGAGVCYYLYDSGVLFASKTTVVSDDDDDDEKKKKSDDEDENKADEEDKDSNKEGDSNLTDEKSESEETTEAVEEVAETEEVEEEEAEDNSFASCMESFVNGEINAYVEVANFDNCYVNFAFDNSGLFAPGMEVPFEKLATSAKNKADANKKSSTPDVSAEYNVIDYGEYEIGVVRFNNLNLSSAGDNSSTSFFFIWKDEKLTLCYAVDSKPENEVVLTENGTMFGTKWENDRRRVDFTDYLDSQGRRTFIYREETLFGSECVPYDIFVSIGSTWAESIGMRLVLFTAGNNKVMSCYTTTGRGHNGISKVLSYYYNQGFYEEEPEVWNDYIYDSYLANGLEKTEYVLTDGWVQIE